MTAAGEPAVISLGLTKSGKRQGAAESVTISELSVLRLIWRWKQHASTHEFLTAKPHIWRDTFSECLQALHLESWNFRPYSLRRGGATNLFVKVGSLDRVLILGRWTAVKTAKIYLNSGLAMLADIQIPLRQLRPFHLVFTNFLSSVQTLEPAPFGSRTGERGNTKRVGKSKAKKASKPSKSPVKKVCHPGGVVRSFSFRPIFCPLLLSAWFSPVWRGSGEHKRGAISAPVWRELKLLEPLISSRTNICISPILIFDKLGLHSGRKEGCECLYIYNMYI